MGSCLLTQSLWLWSPSLVGYNCVCTYPPLMDIRALSLLWIVLQANSGPQGHRTRCSSVQKQENAPAPHTRRVWVGELSLVCLFSAGLGWCQLSSCPGAQGGTRDRHLLYSSISPWMSWCSRGRAVYWQCQLKWYCKKLQVGISILFKT